MRHDIHNKNEDELRLFYEKYPYPEPVEDLDDYRKQWQDKHKRIADFYLFWPDKTFSEEYNILVAGCGTSQAAKHAMRHPEARVTGIDFNSTGIDHTNKLKDKYNLTNLNVIQLSVENVKELAMSFDKIICTGVLHHLPDPEAGLKALREVLKPDGAIHLMVYAPYGRTGIYMMQEFCRLLSIQADDTSIRKLMKAISGLPPGHPLETLIRNAPDFQHEAALADALLNPRDRAYSVPQLFDFIKKAGMKFGRWIKQAQYSCHCGILSQLPQVEEILKLSLEEQYAAAELFRGTMVRHSFVAYRNDHPRNKEIKFDDDNWMDYIPVRLQDTICVFEQLPEGAAAILFNKTPYRDLYMPVNTSEKNLYDAIDGNCIDNIIKKTFPSSDRKSNLEISRTFFEKLWWYDQIVFDTTKSLE